MSSLSSTAGAAAVSDELHVGNDGDHGELSRWQAAAV
jgi:hypothetical protein